MRYEYQTTNRYFAQVADDIKDLAVNELSGLGATDISPAYRGVFFNADRRTLYAVNLCSRLINRVLAPLDSFVCHADKYLYKRVHDLEWEEFLDPSQTFAVFAQVSHSAIKHSRYAALRVKDGIVDYFRDKTGKRPSVDTRNPDVWINLHMQNNQATISLDTSGGSLHRRGYRKVSVEAPMIETLAAAIIDLTGWKGEGELYDPFCGSGTFLCEALLKATNTPPGVLRKSFGFERLPDFDPLLWEDVRQSALKNSQSLKKDSISGSDVSEEAVGAARANCAVLDKEGAVIIKRKDVFDISELKNRCIVCNPPYGIRMGRKKDLSGFYRAFGDFLKQRCTGSTVYIYFGQRKYIKSMGLRSSWKKILFNGGLEGRLVKYELY